MSRPESRSSNEAHRAAVVAFCERRFADAGELARQALERARGETPVDQDAVGKCLVILGRTLASLGRFDEAQSTLATALETGGENAVSEGVRAQASFALGEMLSLQFRFSEALYHLQSAHAGFVRAYGGEHPAVAQACAVSARTFYGLRRPDDAERHLNRAISILSRRNSDSPDLLRYLLDLSQLQANTARPIDAKETLKIFYRTAGNRPIGYPLNEIVGAIQFKLGEYAEAARWLREAIGELGPRTEGRDIQKLTRALSMLGLSHLRLGQHGDAESVFLRQLANERSRQPPDDRAVGVAMNNVAVALREQGRLKEAESLQVEALKTQEAVAGTNDPILVNTLKNLGLVLQRQSRQADALNAFTRAIEIAEKALGKDHPKTVEVRNCIASLTA